MSIFKVLSTGYLKFISLLTGSWVRSNSLRSGLKMEMMKALRCSFNGWVSPRKFFAAGLISLIWRPGERGMIPSPMCSKSRERFFSEKWDESGYFEDDLAQTDQVAFHIFVLPYFPIISGRGDHQGSMPLRLKFHFDDDEEADLRQNEEECFPGG